MKKLKTAMLAGLAVLAVLAGFGYVRAQQINPSQIKPGTNGYVLRTNLGVTVWEPLPIFTYPGAGIPCSTGSAWCASYGTVGTGNSIVLPSGTAGAGKYIDGGSYAWTALPGSGVTQIIAGANVTISPGGGTGAVTVNASGGGGGGGNIPSNAIFVFTGTSMNDDDNHVLSSAVTITG